MNCRRRSLYLPGKYLRWVDTFTARYTDGYVVQGTTASNPNKKWRYIDRADHNKIILSYIQYIIETEAFSHFSYLYNDPNPTAASAGVSWQIFTQNNFARLFASCDLLTTRLTDLLDTNDGSWQAGGACLLSQYCNNCNQISILPSFQWWISFASSEPAWSTSLTAVVPAHTCGQWHYDMEASGRISNTNFNTESGHFKLKCGVIKSQPFPWKPVSFFFYI